VYPNKWSNYFIFYVDDIIILNPKKYRKEADEITQKLMAKYEIRDLGDRLHTLPKKSTGGADSLHS
jgi:hypothetical protein